jgi:hypothetical protein
MYNYVVFSLTAHKFLTSDFFVRLFGLISLQNRYERLSDKVDHPFSVPCQRMEEIGHISAPIYLIVGYTLANDWIAIYFRTVHGGPKKTQPKLLSP